MSSFRSVAIRAQQLPQQHGFLTVIAVALEDKKHFFLSMIRVHGDEALTFAGFFVEPFLKHVNASRIQSDKVFFH